jgi:hypothetical protein
MKSNSNNVSDVNDKSVGLKRPLDLNRKRFTQIFNNAVYRDLTESFTNSAPFIIVLPRLQRSYIYKEIDEQGR